MAISLFIDRISSGIATLIYDEGEFCATLPTSALPDGALEGDWLRATFEIDPGKKERMRREIDSLMDELER
jgi:hypothetical protein